ncbi:MAG: dTDP-4-dehydrorhamnose reductase family protein [Anaerolineae bacterium]
MRVLILGASGMLGHKCWQVCKTRFETWGTVRGNAGTYAHHHLFSSGRLLGGVDATDLRRVVQAVQETRPAVVINCIGIVKQLPEASDPVACLTVNALFPHQLARLCAVAGARLIHISTDCVFSGRRGAYQEADSADAEDLYGRSKLLGEVCGEGTVTLRTSIVGRELRGRVGLVEWFLSQRGCKVQGYRQAIFSGLTTIELAEVVADVIDKHSSLQGLYHVSADPISKHQLLVLLREAFSLPIEVQETDGPWIDRSLDSTRFRTATGFAPRCWPKMIERLAQDPTPYDLWRR